MSSSALMIDLGNFTKSGVRLPKKLRDWMKTQVMTLEGRVEYIDGEDMTLEGIMAIGLLHLREMGEEEREDLVRRLAPVLMEMFEAEMPGGANATDPGPPKHTGDPATKPAGKRRRSG